MNVLVLAPHADDETLGCGATIARLAAEGHQVTVGLVTGPGENGHPFLPSAGFARVREELHAACAILGVSKLIMENIPAVGAADEPRHRLNAIVKHIVEAAQPEMLFAPFPFDLHSDHREIYQAASVSWRPYLPLGHQIREVFCYEVQSETHLNIPYVEQGFLPNVWFDIGDHIETKLQALACFASQAQPAPLPRSAEAVKALATWRGSQIGVAAAEAFVCVRSLR